MTTGTTATLTRPTLATLLAFHAPSGHALPFAIATRVQSAERTSLAVTVRWFQTWQRARGR